MQSVVNYVAINEVARNDDYLWIEKGVSCCRQKPSCKINDINKIQKVHSW